jgi:hypothetical protein
MVRKNSASFFKTSNVTRGMKSPFTVASRANRSSTENHYYLDTYQSMKKDALKEAEQKAEVAATVISGIGIHAKSVVDFGLYRREMDRYTEPDMEKWAAQDTLMRVHSLYKASFDPSLS